MIPKRISPCSSSRPRILASSRLGDTIPHPATYADPFFNTLLERERSEAERSLSNTSHAVQLAELAQTLFSNASIESERLADVRHRLLLVCTVLPIAEETLRGATELTSAAGLSLEDALVLESVRRDVANAAPGALLLTRDKKDFNLPQVQRRLGCRIIFDFEDGLSAIRHALEEGR